MRVGRAAGVGTMAGSATAPPADPTEPAPRDGRQARWDEHNRQRRQRILDAAVVVLEGGAPGVEFHVQQIAQQAGINRTVVYRHFTDRDDLDRAIRSRIQSDLAARLVPEVNLDGSMQEIIARIVRTYVEWVVAHPSLHAFADLDGPGDEPGTAQISMTVADLIRAAVHVLEVDLSDDDRAWIEPLAFGLVGTVMGAVRRWISRPVLEPSAERLATLLARSVWNLLDGHIRRLGLDIDPTRPVAELVPSP